MPHLAWPTMKKSGTRGLDVCATYDASASVDAVIDPRSYQVTTEAIAVKRPGRLTLIGPLGVQETPQREGAGARRRSCLRARSVNEESHDTSHCCARSRNRSRAVSATPAPRSSTPWTLRCSGRLRCSGGPARPQPDRRSRLRSACCSRAADTRARSSRRRAGSRTAPSPARLFRGPRTSGPRRRSRT